MSKITSAYEPIKTGYIAFCYDTGSIRIVNIEDGYSRLGKKQRAFIDRAKAIDTPLGRDWKM